MTYAPLSWWDLYLLSTGGVVVFAAFGTISVVLLVRAIRQSRRIKEIRAQGIEAMARVEALEPKRDSDGDRYYQVSLCYDGPQGKVRPTALDVTEAEGKALAVGGTARIAYAPAHPKSVVLLQPGQAPSAVRFPFLLVLEASIFVLVSVVFLGKGVVFATAAVEARDKGQLIDATVIELERHETDDGETYALIWRDETGVIGKSLFHTARSDFAGVGEMGVHIRVYSYEGKSWWEGDLGRPTGQTVPPLD